MGNKTIVNNFKITRNDSIFITNFEIGEFITVTDSICLIPEDAMLSVFRLSDLSLENNYEINTATGKFQFFLEPGDEYVIKFTANNRIYNSYYVNLLDSGYSKINLNVNSDTIRIDKPFLKDIVYIQNDTCLANRTLLEIKFLNEFLKQNPEIFIDVRLVNKDMTLLTLDSIRKVLVNKLFKDNGVNIGQISLYNWAKVTTSDTTRLTGIDQITKQIIKDVKAEELTNPTIVPKVIYIKPVLFEYNKFSTLLYNEMLDSLAEFLINYSTLNIEISGHTDSKGSETYNMGLALKRADFVRKYLLKKGVPAKQLRTSAKGASERLAEDRKNGKFIDDAGRYNRRVEFLITNKDGNNLLKFENITIPDNFKVHK